MRTRNKMAGKLWETLFINFTSGKFRAHYKNYLFQSLIVFACVSAVLFLDSLFGAIIVASLGASSFIIFITPHTNGSRSKNIIGGYICGSISGVAFNFLHSHIASIGYSGVDYPLLIICAAAAAVTTFMMISFNLVHPPSAALAIGVCVCAESLKTIAAALLSVAVFCVIRLLLRKYLKNLI